MASFNRIFRLAAAAGAIASVISAHDANAAPPDIPLPPMDVPNSAPQKAAVPSVPAVRNDPYEIIGKQGLYMVFGEATSAIPAHQEFCNRLPAECAFKADKAAVYKLDKKRMAAIMEINVAANRTIYPMTDLERYGTFDLWTYPVAGRDGKLYGDCEDYVLYKMKELEKMGVPKSSMSIVAVAQQNGDGHAILALHTDQGDLILDNIGDDILLPPQTGYSFRKALSFTNHARWQSVQIGQAVQEPPVAQTKKRPDPIGNLIHTLGR